MSVKSVKSWAQDSSATYAGNDNFRIRKTSEGNLRIHVCKNDVRVRADYYAMDINLDDFIQAAGIIVAKKA
jgi:hypothetical protein